MTNKITFAHLRRVDEWGGASPYGGVTIAMLEDGPDLRIGIAVCHEHDRYVKSIGRVRAEGRCHSMSADNAKFRALLTGVTVQDVFRSIDGTDAPTYLDELIPTILRGAGAQM